MTAPQRRTYIGRPHDPANLVTVQNGVRDPDSLSVDLLPDGKGIIVHINGGTDESGWFDLTPDEAIAVARAILQGLSR